MYPDSTPFADAPFALKVLWNKFALSGEVDARNLPTTLRKDYNQVVVIQLRHMGAVMQEIKNVNALMAESQDELLDVNLQRNLATCAACGVRELEHFYSQTKQHDGLHGVFPAAGRAGYVRTK